MVVIKKVSAKEIFDSRKEKTISVSIETNVGKFSASSPSGKSTGKHEADPYKKGLKKDIETLKKLKNYFSDEIIDNFQDLRRVEDIIDRHVGANSFFALESAILKALAKEKKKEIWQIINPKLSRKKIKFPRLVGNIIGGGAHSQRRNKPDFQEFLLVPMSRTVEDSYKAMKDAKEKAETLLKEYDKKFGGKKNDEDAWETSLTNKEVLDLLKKVNLPLGVDVASSQFCKRKKYHYLNPLLRRTRDEQISYISSLAKNSKLYYIEDPFDEDDFESFTELLEETSRTLIVGDDLTVTNYERLKKAIEKKSINAVIIKPNQNGSLLKVKEVCDLTKKHKLKIIFSHRSGETDESILADLAVGFQADFIKCG
ncbi:MAG: hypothetical protein WDZ62_01590, partial [Candidatus Pacearchaeota archaeon]